MGLRGRVGVRGGQGLVRLGRLIRGGLGVGQG